MIETIKNIKFAEPYWFILLIIPALIIFYYLKNKNRTTPTLIWSNTLPFQTYYKQIPYKIYLEYFSFAIKIIVLILMIFALARPQTSEQLIEEEKEIIDIIISLDISGSMLAQDFRPDRLEACKNIAIEFISNRKHDRIGLVVFSSASFTQCPLTTDKAALINILKRVTHGIIEDGTAIGDGLATAVARLKDSDAKSKVIILLTDGVNNAGSIPPLTAAEIAKTYNIRVYTIGIGSIGEAPYPVKTPFGTQLVKMKVEIDENLLKKISEITDGQYFRATDPNKLRQIYELIDKMEKTKIKVKEFRKKNDVFYLFTTPAVILLLFGILIDYTLLKKIP